MKKPCMALLKKLGYKDMGYIPTKKSRVFGVDKAGYGSGDCSSDPKGLMCND